MSWWDTYGGGVLLALLAVFVSAIAAFQTFHQHEEAKRPCLRWGDSYQTLDCTHQTSSHTPCRQYRWHTRRDCLEKVDAP